MSSELAHLQAVAKSTTQYLIVWTVILVWDTLCTLPVEARVLWPREWTLLKVVFLLNRYGTILLEVASATIILTPMSHGMCGRVYWIQPLTIVFVIIVCQTLMSIRIYAIYERERKMGFLLTALVIIEAVGCIAAATQLVPLNLPPIVAKTLHLEGCLVVGKTTRAGKAVLVLAVFPISFDTIILALAMYRSFRVRREFGIQVPILQRILRDGIFYYLVIEATHIVTVVMWFQSDIRVKSFNVPASIVLPSLMCSRMILSLMSRSTARPRPTSFPLLLKDDQGDRRPAPASLEMAELGGSPVDVDTPRSTGPPHLNPLPNSPVLSAGGSTDTISTIPLTPTSPAIVLPFLDTTPPPPRNPSPSRPPFPTRPSLVSRKSEQTIESTRSRKSQGSSEPSILAIQVTTETVISVVVDDDDPVPSRSRPVSTSLPKLSRSYSGEKGGSSTPWSLSEGEWHGSSPCPSR
ncbi:hypothetical protein JCM16303_004975 [Sporobolomyces ruberrimus]